MHCPVCAATLTQQNSSNHLFSCPNGHGTLVTGKFLHNIEEESREDKSVVTSHTNTSHELACPHCSNTMHKVDYNHTGVIIDACVSCHYRWLDAGEINKIKQFKPTTDARDLLFIAGVDERIHQAKKPKVTDPNPRLPLQGSYRAGAEVVSLLVGGHKVRHGAILGQGAYGVYRGLTHSRLSRILTLVTFLVLGAMFVIVFWFIKEAF